MLKRLEGAKYGWGKWCGKLEQVLPSPDMEEQLLW